MALFLKTACFEVTYVSNVLSPFISLLIKSDNEEYVFDYFIDENYPLRISQWIEKMQLKTFHCEVQPADLYLFYTNPSEIKKNGVFGGTYFRPISSKGLHISLTKSHWAQIYH